MRQCRALILAFVTLCGVSTVLFTQAAIPASAATPSGATYTAGTPVVATITNGASAAPWNEYQGDPGTSGSPNAAYASQSPGTVLPTYTPGGAVTTTGGVTEPNLAVFPGASTGTVSGAAPYAAGVVGTPGTLDGYCGTGSDTTEAAGSPVRQPAGTTLPLAPAYFPHIVRNADGTLTGYFDYRPKDADESIVAATSTDGGQDWTYDGEALEGNPSYCPVADTTDDGEGHQNVLTINGNSYMYTLPRAAGDNNGVGMIVHQFTPTESNPLGALPATEKVGIDPDAFVPAGTASINLTGTSSLSIPLTSLGTPGSPEQLVAGSFIDLTANPLPSTPVIINCGVSTAPAAPALTGCDTTSGSTPAKTSPVAPGQPITIRAGDLIEQVLGFTTASSDLSNSGGIGGPVPSGPNNTLATGGIASITIDPVQATVPAGGFTQNDFTNPVSGALFNADVPLRLYMNGTVIYCTGANAYQTNHLEDCTAGSGNPPFSISSEWEPITGDPIIPATAYDPAAGDGMTNGLVAPDGIVGTLPSYPSDGSVPSDATYVMYTEKVLNYFVVGATSATKATAFSNLASTGLNFFPGSSYPEDLPSNISAANPVTVTLGDNTLASLTTPVDVYVPVTCTGLTSGGINSGTGLATDTLTGCTAPSSISGTSYSPSDTFASNGEIAAPGAALVPPSTLALTGEGDPTSAKKLFKNNEDLSVLRVAWTTDGVNFFDSGLNNGGIITGSSNNSVSSTGAVTCTAANATSASNYQDINNPCSTQSPSNLNAYSGNDAANGTAPSTGGSGTNGTADLDEMRWVGSAGSVIVNPDGSYGLFLSGAWAADGDSDAFNQVFYSSSTNGEDWSVPTTLVSTDYSFAASVTQDNELAAGQDDPLGISAYYSGRAYAPSVVQNPNGTLTMVFGGDRIPKSIATAGSVLGTNPSARYTIGATDPALYRNILSVTLQSATSPAVPTTTGVSSNITSSTTVGSTVIYSATVTQPAAGSTPPTGSVSFATNNGVISGCGAQPLNESTPDIATCTIAYEGPVDNSVQATYSGDSNYAISSSTPLTTTVISSSDGGSGVVGESITYTATVADVAPATGTPTGAVDFSDTAGSVADCGDQPLTTVDGAQVATCTVTGYNSPTTDAITANYLGDAIVLPSFGTFTESVGQAQTSTSVTTSNAGVSVEQPVTYTATVQVNYPGSGEPTGTVTFTGNAGTLCSTTLNEGTPDTATCTTSYATEGTDMVSASYAGDGNYSGSSSSGLTETISGLAPRVSITTPPDTAAYVVNQLIIASYNCAAGVGGTLKSCVGTVTNGSAINTSTAGTKTFVVSATDTDGKTTSVTSTYTVYAQSSAHNANCSGILPPGLYQNVTVSANCSVTVADDILGNLQVQQGGSLQDTAASISGNLQANNARWVDLRGGSVGGNLQVQGLSAAPSGTGDGATANDICGLSVLGNVQVQNNSSGAPLDIGAGPDCTTGLLVGGNLQVQNNAGKVVVGSSGLLTTVVGNVQVNNNSGGGALTDTSSGGNCQLQNDTPWIVGSSNSASGNDSCNRMA